MEIDKMLLDLEDYTYNANYCKDMVLTRLLKDKIITVEQYKEYCEKWQMIVIKQSWFEKWANIFCKAKGEYMYKYVRFED